MHLLLWSKGTRRVHEVEESPRLRQANPRGAIAANTGWFHYADHAPPRGRRGEGGAITVNFGWLLYAENRPAPFRQNSPGAFTAKIRWRHYAAIHMAPYGCSITREKPESAPRSRPAEPAAGSHRDLDDKTLPPAS